VTSATKADTRARGGEVRGRSGGGGGKKGSVVTSHRQHGAGAFAAGVRVRFAIRSVKSTAEKGEGDSDSSVGIGVGVGVGRRVRAVGTGAGAGANGTNTGGMLGGSGSSSSNSRAPYATIPSITSTLSRNRACKEASAKS
jgi:hypothetical protein